MDVNLTSAFLTCKHALPMMEAQGGGTVVNVSSIAGLRYIGKPQVAYAAAKAALIQMTKTTAVIYADRGIRLNCVVPGLMDTPLVRRLADKYAGGDYEGFAATRAKQVPMGADGRFLRRGPCRPVPRLRGGALHHRHGDHRRWRHHGGHALIRRECAGWRAGRPADCHRG